MYFFVDAENTVDLSGSKYLSQSDNVLVFYTQNNGGFNKRENQQAVRDKYPCNFTFINVPCEKGKTPKNHLDLAIASRLGVDVSAIGLRTDYYVVSGDRHFDFVCKQILEAYERIYPKANCTVRRVSSILHGILNSPAEISSASMMQEVLEAALNLKRNGGGQALCEQICILNTKNDVAETREPVAEAAIHKRTSVQSHEAAETEPGALSKWKKWLIGWKGECLS